MSEIVQGRSKTGRGVGSVNLVHSWVNRIRIVRKDHQDRVGQQRAHSAPISVADRRAELLAFYDRYEQFVEVLCDAAQFGPAPRLETAYAEQRDSVMNSYANLAPYLKMYLRGDVDAFEGLTQSESLHEFIGNDDGSVIEWITQSREALTLYGEHLRQLAAAQS